MKGWTLQPCLGATCTVTSHESGPKVSQQNIIRSSPCLHHMNQDPRFPSRTSSDHHPASADLPSPHNVKENLIHQTRTPSSIAPWSSSDAHVSIVGFGWWTGVSMAL
ncbi:hypothetical protein LDENG_00159370 [Lucifuga dentata]|nr:hypothetical protein LDENG_00159370 [Lucifuga dentata]